jgi:hypothetical protein
LIYPYRLKGIERFRLLMAQGSGAVMQKINKTSAPIAAAFFVFSLAIMPFSLKVVGFTLSISPSMSAVVDVWNQIAGSYGSGHQSAAAELIAISNLYSIEASDPAIDDASGDSLLASLQKPDGEELYQVELVAEAEAFDGLATRSENIKPVARPAHTVKRADAESYYMAIRAGIERRAEALKAAETAQRELARHGELLAGLDKQLAAVKFDFKMFRNLPFNKEFKVLVKMKPVKPAVASRLAACGSSKASTGDKPQEVRQAETRVRAMESAAISFDNCEL